MLPKDPKDYLYLLRGVARRLKSKAPNMLEMSDLHSMAFFGLEEACRVHDSKVHGNNFEGFAATVMYRRGIDQIRNLYWAKRGKDYLESKTNSNKQLKTINNFTDSSSMDLVKFLSELASYDSPSEMMGRDLYDYITQDIPEKYRPWIKARLLDGLTLPETASMLGFSESWASRVYTMYKPGIILRLKTLGITSPNIVEIHPYRVVVSQPMARKTPHKRKELLETTNEDSIVANTDDVSNSSSSTLKLMRV